MKKTYSLLLFVMALAVTSFTTAQTVILTAPSFSSSPMGTVENNAGVIGSVEFVETTGTNVKSQAFGQANVTISINFQYVKLTNDDVEGVAGTLLDYFDPYYNPTTNILTFEQNGLIPGGWKGVAQIPMDVTQNSTEEQSYNGFNANISAIDGKTVAQGNASVFSFTKSEVLSSNTIEETLNFEVSPNPTQDFLNIVLENDSANKVQLFDLYGKLVFDEDYTNSSNQVRLNIRHLASAVYVLKVTSDTATYSTRVIRK